MIFQKIVADQLSRLYPKGKKESISFHITENLPSSLAKCTYAHVKAIHYSFMDKPQFFVCENFYANCSFGNMCSTTKGINHYNKINPKDKIHKFNTIEELYQHISILESKYIK